MRNMSRTFRLLIPVLALGLILSGCTFLPWFASEIAVAQTSSLSYPIVDTSQALTYDNVNALASQPQAGEPFYGQDAQIDGKHPAYADNGDGTVTDLVTGLMWQQGYSGKMSQREAAAGASSFDLAGYTDWRLPSIKELYSLIDFSGEDVDPLASAGNNPFIDTDYFNFAYGDISAGQRIIDSQWATTSLYVAGNLMFGVNFADGRIKGYGLTSPRGGDMQFYVRYVRGNTAYGQNDFVSNGDGTISDLATGLMWSRDDSGASSADGTGMDWEAALAYVQDLNDANYLGYSDWTLPNAKELQSIVDYTRSPDTTNSAAIDPIFNATAITNEDGDRDWAFYWTSTTHARARSGEAAVYVAFGRGLGYMSSRYVDVHGAGCQRSDPKSGSAIPTGRGPQGDTVRVANYVRAVRNESATGYATSFNPSLGSAEIPDSDLAVNSSDTGEAGGNDQQYVLFAPLGGEEAYLIDRQGDLVNTWALAGRPGNSVYLLEGGNLLATYTIEGTFRGGGIGGGVELLTWDGAEVWSFELASDHAHLHHDVEMLPNGNVLMISWESKTRAEALAAGLSANQLPVSGEVWSEMILEYNPDLDQVVWEWHLWDHVLPFGQSATQHPEKIDLAYASNRQSSDWWHLNAIDYSADLDQIVVSSRNVSEIWIIDHDLTTAEATGSAGDLLYRYGNPEAYGASGIQGLLHQHDSEWLDENTLLVFDNGDPELRPYSRVLELDLPDYGSSLSSRVLTAQVVWQYPNEQDVSRDTLFADHISGAQRLESGNTLICSGTEGRFFEVTPEGATVWEYVNPYTSTGRDGKESNEVFRCEAVYLSLAQVGASSSAQNAPQNIEVGEQSPSVPVSATQLPGIASIQPSSVEAGAGSRLVTITLDPQRMPPAQVQFTSIAIGDIQATSWNRSGLSIQAWFLIPESIAPGDYQLHATFPGRSQEPITFSHPVSIN